MEEAFLLGDGYQRQIVEEGLGSLTATIDAGFCFVHEDGVRRTTRTHEYRGPRFFAYRLCLCPADGRAFPVT
jgi:hypothetical protein